jgi:DNA-binding transcriptional MerR regulator
MTERDHHSIGEVLAMVQEDFPDVTISKIRFLESQGLLDPERTTSGYRKFYDRDVERLRWILHQQRDHYLPLKVIKDRIENGFADTDTADTADTATPSGNPSTDPPPDRDRATEPAPVADAAVAADSEPEPPAADPLDQGLSTVSMTADELAAASGLSVEQVEELVRFGLVEPRTIGAADLYEGEALQVARLAADFVGRGVEIRHLKMYRISAEREAGFYEQVISPFAGHRDPATRSRARTEIREMVRLGAELKAALLRRSLRDQLGGP